MRKDDRVREVKYSLQEAASFLGGINPMTVRREIQRGHLGHYRIGGGRIMVGANHLYDYLKSREVRANN